MNEYMLMGLFAGVLVGVILVAVLLKITKKDGRMKCEFDERQTSIRGKGFKISFFTLMIYDAIYGLQGIAVEKPLIDPFAAMMMGICLSIAIYAVYCIWNDAYFSLNENRNRLLAAFGIIAIVNLIIGTLNIVDGVIITDGILNFRITNFVCGILFIVIFIAIFLKGIKNRSEAE